MSGVAVPIALQLRCNCANELFDTITAAISKDMLPNGAQGLLFVAYWGPPNLPTGLTIFNCGRPTSMKSPPTKYRP